MQVRNTLILGLAIASIVLPPTASLLVNSGCSPGISKQSLVHLRMSSKKTVAIIGGGVAGLSCAQALMSSGQFLPTVFDTGRLRPGGRCASRLPNDPPKDDHRNTNEKSTTILDSTIIDHAAQILTIPSGYNEFRTQVEEWEREGVVKKFRERSVFSIGNTLDPKTKQHDKTKLRLQLVKGDMYYGANGMQSIPKALMSGLDLKQDVWVSPSSGVRLVNGHGGKKWEVKAKGLVMGQFDRLVIAHNGKCADRLMSTTPAKDLHRLLQVNFAPFVPRDGGTRMTLNSLYSLTFVVPSDSSLSTALDRDNFICGFIKNHPNLRFISCNTRKHASPSDASNFEVWTILSSAKFGKRYKGSQENLPDELVHQVTGLLLESLEEALILPRGSLYGPDVQETATGSHFSGTGPRGSVFESRLQLWGAGVPVNTWVPDEEDKNACGFLYDSNHGVGACGDWLLDPSLAGAWESGRRLARFMTSDPTATVGLTGKFEASSAVDKVGIGSLSQV